MIHCSALVVMRIVELVAMTSSPAIDMNEFASYSDWSRYWV